MSSPATSTAQAPREGRCGWSWYTGSAGWLWRAATESLCGIEVRHGRLRVRPCLPPDWDRAEVMLRSRSVMSV